MSDRSSARAFGTMFRVLATHAEGCGSGGDHELQMLQSIARDVWVSDAFRMCDFTHDQMEADEALIKLGLARRGAFIKHLDEEEELHYADQKGRLAPDGLPGPLTHG